MSLMDPGMQSMSYKLIIEQAPQYKIKRKKLSLSR